MFRTYCTVGSALTSQVCGTGIDFFLFFYRDRVLFSPLSTFFSFLFLIPDSLLHNCLSRPEESRTCLSACIVLHTARHLFSTKKCSTVATMANFEISFVVSRYLSDRIEDYFYLATKETKSTFPLLFA